MGRVALGRVYRDGEIVVRQGGKGDCMHVIQEGQVEVFVETAGHEVRLAVVYEGDFVGEMSLIDKGVRSATVRSLGESRVLTVDRKVFLKNLMSDTTSAFHILETMSHRIRKLDVEVVRLKEEMASVKEIVEVL